MHKKLYDWFRWQRILSRQIKLFHPNAAASGRMLKIRAAIWRKLLQRLSDEFASQADRF